MAKRMRTPSLPQTISPVTRKLLDRFPIAHRDDASDYQALLGAVFETLQPQDIIEELLVRDVADLAWEVQRLRTVEAILLTSAPEPSHWFSPFDKVRAELAAARAARGGSLLPLHMRRPNTDRERVDLPGEDCEDHPEEDDAEDPWDDAEQAGKPAAAFGSGGSRPGPPQQSVSTEEARRSAADAFKKNSRAIDQISRLIALAETRRNQALREFERYHTARQARPRPEEIVDAEYTEAPPQRRQAGS
jgi:hypothetical protein